MKSIIRPTFCVRAQLVLLATAFLTAPLASAQIVRDDSEGQQNIGDLTPDNEGVYLIEGEDGISRSDGELLIHSFSEFQLDSSETARYDDTRANNDLNTVTTILTRITGSNASQLDGHIESVYPNADLLFVNPNGVFFGSTFTLDVQQGFHVSTADFLLVTDSLTQGLVPITTAADLIPELSMAVPQAWGFLGSGPSKAIDIQGFNAEPSSGNPTGDFFSFVGSEITLGSDQNLIDMKTEGRGVTLVAVDRANSQVGGTLVLSGPNEFAVIAHDSITGSQIGPNGDVTVRGSISTERSDNLGGQTGSILIGGGFLDVQGDLSTIATNSLVLQHSGSILLFGDDVLFDGTTNTFTANGRAGNTSLFGTSSIEIAPNSDISVASTRDSFNSGSVSLVAPNIIADGITVFGGNNVLRGAGNVFTMSGDNISFTNSQFTGVTTDGQNPWNVQIDGINVDLSDSVISVNTANNNPRGADVLLIGDEELNISGLSVFANAADLNVDGGDGGDITLTSANFIEDSTFVGTVDGGSNGVDGTITFNQIVGGVGIIRDNTDGQVAGPVPFDLDTYTIHGDDGLRRDNGRLVMHSFSDFTLQDGETAHYTDNPNDLGTADYVLSRITGNNPSQINGHILSDYTDADLLFVNPNGVFFGGGFSIDTSQGIHVSTADFLEFAPFTGGQNNILRMDAPDDVADLAFGTPDVWGFDSSGPQKNIVVDGFQITNQTNAFPGRNLSFVGGDVSMGTNPQTSMFTTYGRNLVAVALGGQGRVEGFSTPLQLGSQAITTTDLAGNVVNPTGTVSFQGIADTSRLNSGNTNGNIFFFGGQVDTLGLLNTGAINGQFTNDGGFVEIFGNELSIGSDIVTSSVNGFGGTVRLFAALGLDLGDFRTINTTAFGQGTRAGQVSLLGSTVTANGLGITVANSAFSFGDGNDVFIQGGVSVDMAGASIQGSTVGDAIPTNITVVGGSVNLEGASFNVNTTGDAQVGGSIVVSGIQQLDLTNAVASTQALGNGNGGDIIITTTDLIGDFPAFPAFDVTAAGSGSDGTLTVNFAPDPNITRDDTPGQTPGPIVPDQNNTYTIHGDDGVRRGGGDLVLHSFSDFNLDSDETARYTDNDVALQDTKYLLTRVTGNDPSQIDGTIFNEYDNADLTFVNANGVFFGDGFSLDTNQSFHVSTADALELRNDGGERVDIDMTSATAVPDLADSPNLFGWRFDNDRPDSVILVDGFNVADPFETEPDSEFTFISDNVVMGLDGGAALSLEAAGRDLTVVAMGRNGSVRGFTNDAGQSTEDRISVVNLSGARVNPRGTIAFNGSIDTRSDDVGPGDVLFVGGQIDVVGPIFANSATDNAVDAGNVVMLGRDITLDSDIFTNSEFGDGGDVLLIARDDITFSGGNFINTASSSAGHTSGDVNFDAGDDVTARISITTSEIAGGANAGHVTVNGDTIDMRGVFIQASTSGDATPAVVDINGRDVDVSFSETTLESIGTGNAGTIEVTGTERLNINSAFAVTRATGTGNGGDITITSANFIDDDLGDHDVSAGVGAEPGVFSQITIDGPTGAGGSTVRESSNTLEQLTSEPRIDDPAANDLNDPIGFGDLQPFESSVGLAATPSVDAGPDDSGDESTRVASSRAGSTSSTGTSGDSNAPPPIEGLSQAVQEEIVAVSASAEAEAQRKSTPIPGVSLFTNASETAPLVPRTCDSIAGRETKTRLLARSNKRIPTSPEDWLIAFDTTGDRLLASAENPDLPPVASVDGSSEASDDIKRSARTQRALATAAAAIRSGRIEEASAGFEQAVNNLEQAGDPHGASEALLAYSQLQLGDGRFAAARLSLDRALALAEPLGDEDHTAAIRSSLGNALIGTGELVRAEAELTRGLNVVMASKNEKPAASVLNNLGNRHAATHDFDSALWAYKRSAKIAQKLGNKADQARALSGAARAAADSGKFAAARSYLDDAMALVADLDQDVERAPLYIHMGSTFARFASLSPTARTASLLSAYEAFDGALKAAEVTGDLRGIALANLNLGALYQDEQHRSEALYLTRLALRAAEGIDAPELLYRAHWQEGQILWSEHQVNASLAAHRRAVAILEQSKPVASDGYGSSDASFRMAVGGVYQDTVDLLLRAASMTPNPVVTEGLIVEARDTLEKLKAAELRDYFEDECIANIGGSGRDIAALGGNAAVIYTVTLPDRIELLVGLPTGVERFTTEVSAAMLVKTVDAFRTAVQNPLTNKHRVHGRKLYQWTVAPYADRLAEAGIETLVFIPDGRLRTVPFAALSDGDTYLSDRYATATALSLRLLAPTELASEIGRPVLAGVSESVQGFSALAAVDRELAEIQAIEGGELLLNDRFTLEGIRDAVSREVPGVVHLATHAVFTGNPDTSFLLTYGGRVGFDELSDVVGMTRADGAPLDLLVLSACETAVGNDRAGLGFTGSAIRAGARSALGSLWPISDAAAGELMIDFYRGLQLPDVSKAEALRKAQTSLRDNERFEHPFYWAPFTLVNDWM